MIRLGLVGKGIQHSLSPSLHNNWLLNAGLEGIYDLLDLDSFDQFYMNKLVKEGYRGVNITMPHKTIAAKIVDNLEPVAVETGTVNSIKFGDESVGTNNDALALVSLLTNSQVPSYGVVLGDGATARSSVWALRKIGCSSIAVVSRRHRIEGVEKFEWDDLPMVLFKADILVNASPLGMVGHPPLLMNENVCSKNILRIVEWVYNPKETELLKWAFRQNISCIKGYDLLVEQARLAFHFWLGIFPTD